MRCLGVFGEYFSYKDYRYYLFNKWKNDNLPYTRDTDVRWHNDFVTIKGVALYPENSMLLSFNSSKSKEALIRIKQREYFVDCYRSSERLVDDTSALLEFLSNYFVVPDIYYNCLPQTKYCIQYDKTFFFDEVSKIDDESLIKKPLIGSLMLDDPILPIFTVSLYMGEVLGTTFSVIEPNKHISNYKNKYKKIRRDVSSTFNSTYSGDASFVEKRFLDKIRSNVNVSNENVEVIAKKVVNLLMISMADVYITVIEGIPTILNVMFKREPMVYDFINNDTTFYHLVWDAFYKMMEDENTIWGVCS